MGSTRPEREDARARSESLAAARRFSDAVAAYLAIGVPLAPRRGGAELPPWDREQIAILLQLQDALGTLISNRRSYDAGRRRPG